MMTSKSYENFQFDVDERNIATISLNVPNRPVNILNETVISELDAIVREIEKDASIQLSIFQSGKESGFLAGADVHAIAEIGSAAEAIRVIETGQNLFQRIAWLPMPTIAIIHGPCMGGGLELALSCDFRVARDNISTKLGLPEIKLGLIPGWGGTQRLPELVGVRDALSMILTGKHVSAVEAHKMNLVDAAITPENWAHGTASFIDAIYRGNSPTKSGSGWRKICENSRLGRHFFLKMAARSIRGKQSQYPALGSALRCIHASCKRSPEGYATERNEFVALLGSQTCRHLMDLFFARERARNLHTWSDNTDVASQTKPIQKVGIVGAGSMGAGIGQLAALRGFEVLIREINPNSVTAGEQRINQLIQQLANRKKWATGKANQLRSKITINCNESLLDDCDLVIEAVIEREDVKQNVFADLDLRVKKPAILTTNTSSLSVERMSDATSRKNQVAGLHFFNPVHRMELVEVVQGSETSDRTIHQLVSFVKALGKTPIVTSDTPGFLVNRVLFPYLGEAIRMMQEGANPQIVDSEIRRFGMPMGPLELLDQVGLDIAYHVASSLKQVLPETEAVVDYLGTLTNEGRLGKKSNMGFYHYQNGKRGKPVISVAGGRGWSTNQDTAHIEDGLTSIQRRLIYPMIAEAVRCHSEGVVHEPWAIDLGMVLGTGFAPHRGGPLHLIDTIGAHHVLSNMLRLRDRHGQRFTPPKALANMSATGNKFFCCEETAKEKMVNSE